ncbi:hypothetical protein KM043_013187 [Ampulex compressa]|nr:hypothetical protein KM043_013187 [Ampulex compressa]
MLSIDTLAEERRTRYQQKGAIDPNYAEIEARVTSLNRASRAIDEDQLGTRITPDNLVELTLQSANIWTAVSACAAAVMKELRRAVRARKKTRPEDQAAIE